ncbi:unnamed protein product [Allacma fusca]|uniref:Uncharacterized protein n=1 Tax=Allacma fusca TaxID=39272 RepID=A0A8J2JET8_9HEXA|nr:unnamed protein product [Allacma fusca]
MRGDESTECGSVPGVLRWRGFQEVGWNSQRRATFRRGWSEGGSGLIAREDRDGFREIRRDKWTPLGLSRARDVLSEEESRVVNLGGRRIGDGGGGRGGGGGGDGTGRTRGRGCLHFSLEHRIKERVGFSLSPAVSSVPSSRISSLLTESSLIFV